MTECRYTETRLCPLIYAHHGCDNLPCARFESEDDTLWATEIENMRKRLNEGTRNDG